MIRLSPFGKLEHGALSFKFRLGLFLALTFSMVLLSVAPAIAAPSPQDTATWTSPTNIKVGVYDFRRTQAGPSEWVFTNTADIGFICKSTLTFITDPYASGGGQQAIRDYNVIANPNAANKTCEAVSGGDGRIPVVNSVYEAYDMMECIRVSGSWDGTTCYQSSTRVTLPTAGTTNQVACEAQGGSWQNDQCVAAECSNVAQPESMRFIVCPVIEALTGFMGLVDGMIAALLDFNNEELEASNAKAAWNNFRVISYSLILIAGLIIVIGHALGAQMLDAYTIKKALPRLLVAVIFIAISWDLLLFVTMFFNDLGHWTQAILLEPFAEAQEINLGKVLGMSLSGSIALVGIAGYLVTIGMFGTLTLLGVAALSLLIGIVVLGVRAIFITLAIIVAPFAIACFILPGTQKIWDLWRKGLTTALVVFPIIMALLAAGKIAADITTNGLFALVFFLAPYFLIPFTFKFAGGLMGRIAGMADDKSRGVFDRARKYRAGKASQNIAAMKAGSRFSDRNKLAKKFNRTTAGIASGVDGNFGFGNRGRIAAGQNALLESQNVGKTEAAMKINEDDNAKHALVRLNSGMSQEQTRQQLITRMQQDPANAGRSQAQLEADADNAIDAAKATGLHGRASAVWAAKQLAATGTGYLNQEDMAYTSALASGGNLTLAEDIGGFNNMISKQKSRNDLAPGAGNAISSIMEHSAAIQRGAGGPIATSYQRRAAAAKSVTPYTLGQLKPQAMRNHREYIQMSLDADANDMELNTATGLMERIGEAEAMKRRHDGAIATLELQRAVQTGATGEVQEQIQEFMQDNGINPNQTQRDAVVKMVPVVDTTGSPVWQMDPYTNKPQVDSTGAKVQLRRPETGPSGEIIEYAPGTAGTEMHRISDSLEDQIIRRASDGLRRGPSASGGLAEPKVITKRDLTTSARVYDPRENERLSRE